MQATPSQVTGIVWTITLGEALQVLTFLFAGVALYVRLSNKIAMVEAKVNLIYTWWQMQINAYKNDFEELEGRGGGD